MNDIVEEYTPDNWVVLKFKHLNIPHMTGYKVLAGWSGGYLDGDCWRMNSGIEKVEEDGDFWLFHGYSGSVYRCGKSRYGLRNNNAHIYDSLKQHYPEIVELMDEDTNWFELSHEEVDSDESQDHEVS